MCPAGIHLGAEADGMRRSSKFATAAFVVAMAASTSVGAIAGSGAAAAAANPAGYAGPARSLGNRHRTEHGTAQLTSRNWDGYITYAPDLGTDFNAVKATWVQPTVRCEAKNAWTVFWVGLDGWYDNTVEQGGSSAYCPKQGGAAQYSLWWEMFPTNSIQSVLTINAGDTVTANVTYAPATQVFTIRVRDVTSAQGFTKKERCASGLACDRSSADVITEDVGMFGAGNFFPLADYGTMGYTGIKMTDVAGHTSSISGRQWLKGAVTESANGVTYATVSRLTANGSAFTTTWKHR
jgi:hypothetical protein